VKQQRNSGDTIWLLRHGESTWNASGLVQGQAEGPELTPTGREQVAAVSAVVSRLPVTTIISSDLARAHQTASIISVKLDMAWVSDVDLRERDFGCAQGRPLGDLGPEWSGVDGGRVVDAEARPPGGESLHDFSQRVDRFFSRLAQRQHRGDVLVVTHGGVIRMALAKCDRVPVSRMAWGSVPNAGLWSLGKHEICPPVLLSSV
jgi:2,3-bisphosphoglycerate-dependent phosphoglycerate mutase